MSEDAAKLLLQTDLFAGIDTDAADELADRLVRREFKRGQAVFHQGDPGDALYVITEGSVQIVVTSETGDRMVLTTMHSPEVLGEIALLDRGKRSATAEAMEDTVTLMLSRGAFLDLMRENPGLVDQLLRSLGALVRRLSEQAADFVFLDLGGRVAKVLLRLAEDATPAAGGMPLEINVTQARLAEMAGGSRQSVNQILQSFAQRGYVEMHGRRVLLCMPEQLRRRAGVG